MGKIIRDKFGNELQCGDNICFTVSLRINQKPIVRVKVAGFITDKADKDWVILGEPAGETGNRDYGRAVHEKKLPKKVVADRVVKCY